MCYFVKAKSLLLLLNCLLFRYSHFFVESWELCFSMEIVKTRIIPWSLLFIGKLANELSKTTPNGPRKVTQSLFLFPVNSGLSDDASRNLRPAGIYELYDTNQTDSSHHQPHIIVTVCWQFHLFSDWSAVSYASTPSVVSCVLSQSNWFVPIFSVAALSACSANWQADGFY